MYLKCPDASLRRAVCSWCACKVPQSLGDSDDGNALISGLADQDDVIEVASNLEDPPARKAGSLKMTPAQLATALTHHSLEDETVEE